jgi:hypothetical protein
VCETDRQLFGEELRRSKQGAYYHQHRHQQLIDQY